MKANKLPVFYQNFKSGKVEDSPLEIEQKVKSNNAMELFYGVPYSIPYVFYKPVTRFVILKP